MAHVATVLNDRCRRIGVDPDRRPHCADDREQQHGHVQRSRRSQWRQRTPSTLWQSRGGRSIIETKHIDNLAKEIPQVTTGKCARAPLFSTPVAEFPAGVEKVSPIITAFPRRDHQCAGTGAAAEGHRADVGVCIQRKERRHPANRRHAGGDAHPRGSVRRAGSRLRVTAQLIVATDGTHLWSQRYDREMSDIFAVQDEIAGAIADALKLKLVRKNERRMPSMPAYEAYLRYRSYQWQFTPEASRRSRACVEQALKLDPEFALPYVGMADYYLALAAVGGMAPAEAMPHARELATRALDLEPELPEAHTPCWASLPATTTTTGKKRSTGFSSPPVTRRCHRTCVRGTPRSCCSRRGVSRRHWSSRHASSTRIPSARCGT